MADRMEITIIGGDAMVKRLSSKVGPDRVNRVIKKNATELQKKMMREASFEKGYQTGTTKRSIMFTLQPGLLSAEVGPGTDYSPYLEYGTRFMDPQPFVRPARDAQTPIFTKDLRDLIKE